MDPLTIVVADDHPIVAAGLRGDLGEGFRIVAEASDATEAIRLIEEHRPDLAIVDVQMPGGGGATVAARCGAHTPIVMLSASEAERDVLEAVAAGAVGYLPKTTPTAELRDALRRAAAGEPVFPPQLAALLVGEFRRLARTAGTTTNPLSEREREVLALVARGNTYKQAAERLYISPRTVENHVRNILDKLHLSRREDLIRYATEHGLD